MSTPQQSSHRYTSVAIILHWLIAACILFNLTLGFFMEGFSPSLRGLIVGLHISSGMTVLALTVVRIAWRMTHVPPALPTSMPAFERWVAAAAHALLYVGMLVLPMTGWIFLSAHHPKPGMVLRVWGLIPFPQIGPIANMSDPAQKMFHDRWVHYHMLGAWSLLGLLVLHVAAAIKHQVLDGENGLARMGIGR